MKKKQKEKEWPFSEGALSLSLHCLQDQLSTTHAYWVPEQYAIHLGWLDAVRLKSL